MTRCHGDGWVSSSHECIDLAPCDPAAPPDGLWCFRCGEFLTDEDAADASYVRPELLPLEVVG